MTADWGKVAQRVLPGATVTGQRVLLGGVSAKVVALDLELPGGERRSVVVKQPPVSGWKHGDDDPSTAEHALLRVLHAAGFPVPEPLALDRSGELLPGPWLAMAHLDGTTELEPAALGEGLEQVATVMARLHALDPNTLDLPPLEDRSNPIPSTLHWLPPEHEGLRPAIERGLRGPVAGPCLLHGDIWPGNLLWSGGTLTALLDWEDAALGDPVSDVAVTRQELAWRYGWAAMEQFTAAYERASGRRLHNLALWHCYVGSAALTFMEHWGLPPEVEAENRKRTHALMRAVGATLLEA